VRPVAYQPVITPAPVAVAPAYVTPVTTIVLASPIVEGEGVALTR